MGQTFLFFSHFFSYPMKSTMTANFLFILILLIVNAHFSKSLDYYECIGNFLKYNLTPSEAKFKCFHLLHGQRSSAIFTTSPPTPGTDFSYEWDLSGQQSQEQETDFFYDDNNGNNKDTIVEDFQRLSSIAPLLTTPASLPVPTPLPEPVIVSTTRAPFPVPTPLPEPVIVSTTRAPLPAPTPLPEPVVVSTPTTRLPQPLPEPFPEPSPLPEPVVVSATSASRLFSTSLSPILASSSSTTGSSVVPSSSSSFSLFLTSPQPRSFGTQLRKKTKQQKQINRQTKPKAKKRKNKERVKSIKRQEQILSGSKPGSNVTNKNLKFRPPAEKSNQAQAGQQDFLFFGSSSQVFLFVTGGVSFILFFIILKKIKNNIINAVVNCFRRSLRKQNNIETNNNNTIELGNANLTTPSTPKVSRKPRTCQLDLASAGSEESVFIATNSAYFATGPLVDLDEQQTRPKETTTTTSRRKSPKVNHRVAKLGLRQSINAQGYSVSDAAILRNSLTRERLDRVERERRLPQPSWGNDSDAEGEAYVNNSHDFQMPEVGIIVLIHLANQSISQSVGRSIYLSNSSDYSFICFSLSFFFHHSAQRGSNLRRGQRGHNERRTGRDKCRGGRPPLAAFRFSVKLLLVGAILIMKMAPFADVVRHSRTFRQRLKDANISDGPIGECHFFIYPRLSFFLSF